MFHTEDIQTNFVINPKTKDQREQVLKEYQEELRTVYRQIDRNSSLLWSHDNSLHRPRRRNVKKEADLDDDNKWKNESKAQLGYGEITKGALQEFLLILQNIDQLFRLEDEHLLTGSKESYRLTENSTFIDIGSGFGKPVFHAAMQVGCASRGIEIVPARVEFCVDYTFDYQDKNKERIERFEKFLRDQNKKQSLTSLTPIKSKRVPVLNKDEFTFHNALDLEEYSDLTKEEATKSKKEQSKKSSKFDPKVVIKQVESVRSSKKLKKSGTEEIKTEICDTKSKNNKRKRTKEQLIDDTTDDRLSGLDLKLVPNYNLSWFRKLKFAQCDAGKLDKLVMRNNNEEVVDISHIYSYNKVMSKECLKGIANSLNGTNFKILAWYVNERATYKLVNNIKLLFKKPMQSTGKEKFSVYVYYKTNGADTSKDEDSGSIDSNDIF